MNCKENFFGMVAEILACPPESVTLTGNVFREEKYIDTTYYEVSNENLTFSVPMKIKSAECSESSNLHLPGGTYTVTVSWELSNPSKNDFVLLRKLKESRNHLIIRMFGDNESKNEYARYFVYSPEYGYKFEYNEDKGIVKCELSVTNINGLQRVFTTT